MIHVYVSSARKEKRKGKNHAIIGESENDIASNYRGTKSNREKKSARLICRLSSRRDQSSEIRKSDGRNASRNGRRDWMQMAMEEKPRSSATLLNELARWNKGISDGRLKFDAFFFR